ncbi:MAG: hypothetical protein QXQ46_10870, partial [Thermoplasmatales archaeon]
RENRELVFIGSELLKATLFNGWIPVLYGDMVFNLPDGTWAIASSELVIKEIAKSIPLNMILVATDKDGVLKDVSKPDTVISTINRKSIDSIRKYLGASEHLDITGGMFAKVVNLYEVARIHGTPLHIFNGRIERLLLRSLSGDESFGTKITN